jgi:hypothetical protein
VAGLATLVTAVSRPHRCTLCKVLLVDLHQVTNAATSRGIVEACLMQRAPLLGGRLCGDAREITGPGLPPYRSGRSWLSSEGLLRGVPARPLLCGGGHRARRS